MMSNLEYSKGVDECRMDGKGHVGEAENFEVNDVPASYYELTQGTKLNLPHAHEAA
jgi:hypothetical protein